MSRLSAYLAAVVFVAILAGTAQADRAARGVPCKSGTYAGKAGGKKLSFVVDCAKMTVSDVKLSMSVECLPDKHRESAKATYSGSTKIKKTTVPDPDHPGKKEKYYYLVYSKPTTDFTVSGTKGGEKPSQVNVFLRGVTPPAGTTKGTAEINYSYGTDPADPEAGYLYNCGGQDGPVAFKAHRS